MRARLPRPFAFDVYFELCRCYASHDTSLLIRMDICWTMVDEAAIILELPLEIRVRFL